MMNRTGGFLLAALLATALADSGPARAQTAGFALDQFNPSDRGSDWFVLDSIDLRGDLREAVGVVGDYAYLPLAIYGENGAVRSKLVERQLFLHVGASMVFLNRFRVAFNLPVALYESGQSGTLNGVTYSSPGAFSVGDFRISADVRLLGAYGDRFRLAAGVEVFAPLGSRSDYTGDDSTRVLPHVLASGDIGAFAYAAEAGFEYRGLDEAYGGSTLGSQVNFGGSVGLRLFHGVLLVGPEVYGAATVARGDEIFKTQTTPLEGLLGAHFRAAKSWRFGFGGGTGLTRGFGSPLARGVAMIEWSPDPDRPRPDGDGDGIPDAEDACPDVKGVKTDDPKTNGCPLDRDGDGIPDAEDACPDEPGPKSSDPKKNGCPPAVVRNDRIVILEQVKFKSDSAEILSSSDPLLQAVLKVFADHGEIKSVSIEGHTDNRGTGPYNKALSARRAASVVAWLVAHGVDPARLTSIGYGLERPIDSNETEGGRQNNRRVEFHIVVRAP
jgi:outer membrane protein OmpA-like peptidoglycan-associated protein